MFETLYRKASDADMALRRHVVRCVECQSGPCSDASDLSTQAHVAQRQLDHARRRAHEAREIAREEASERSHPVG